MATIGAGSIIKQVSELGEYKVVGNELIATVSNEGGVSVCVWGVEGDEALLLATRRAGTSGKTADQLIADALA